MIFSVMVSAGTGEQMVRNLKSTVPGTRAAHRELEDVAEYGSVNRVTYERVDHAGKGG
jgi:hypothetical protein